MSVFLYWRFTQSIFPIIPYLQVQQFGLQDRQGPLHGGEASLQSQDSPQVAAHVLGGVDGFSLFLDLGLDLGTLQQVVLQPQHGAQLILLLLHQLHYAVPPGAE